MQLVNKGKICKAEFCNRPATRKELCARHYERLRQYGNINHSERKQYVHEGWLCSKENCSRLAKVKGLCTMHYNREWQRQNRRPEAKNVGRRIAEHRLQAEKALGRALPIR